MPYKITLDIWINIMKEVKKKELFILKNSLNIKKNEFYSVSQNKYFFANKYDFEYNKFKQNMSLADTTNTADEDCIVAIASYSGTIIIP